MGRMDVPPDAGTPAHQLAARPRSRPCRHAASAAPPWLQGGEEASEGPPSVDSETRRKAAEMIERQEAGGGQEGDDEYVAPVDYDFNANSPQRDYSD